MLSKLPKIALIGGGFALYSYFRIVQTLKALTFGVDGINSITFSNSNRGVLPQQFFAGIDLNITNPTKSAITINSFALNVFSSDANETVGKLLGTISPASLKNDDNANTTIGSIHIPAGAAVTVPVLIQLDPINFAGGLLTGSVSHLIIEGQISAGLGGLAKVPVNEFIAV